MAALLSTHLPIVAVKTISGNQEKIQNFLEASGQTYLQGTPVYLNGSGFVAAWTGTPSYGPPGNILGITNLSGRNYTTNGQGAAPVFGSIGFPGALGAVANVINQPAAYSIYHGAPFADGLANVELAYSDTIFEAQIDNSTGATYNATNLTIGTSVGLTIDASGYWYADLGKVTVGTNAVAVVVGLNPLDLVVGSATTQVNNGRVQIVFAYAVQQVSN